MISMSKIHICGDERGSVVNCYRAPITRHVTLTTDEILPTENTTKSNSRGFRENEKTYRTANQRIVFEKFINQI